MIMIKNNLGWICAIVILLCNPAQASAPTLCLWDMYAMAAIAGRSMPGAFRDRYDDTTTFSADEVVSQATYIANEMIKRRSK